MPKNKGKGGKNRRRGKNENVVKRELVERDKEQEYAQVIRMLGNGRLEAYCFDGKRRLCHIRGKMRKKVWVNSGDIVLVGLRPYQDEKGDVILRYNAEEARTLKRRGHLPSNIKIEDNPDLDNEDNVPFEFTAETSADDAETGAERDNVSTQPSNRGMVPPAIPDAEEKVNIDEL